MGEHTHLRLNSFCTQKQKFLVSTLEEPLKANKVPTLGGLYVITTTFSPTVARRGLSVYRNINYLHAARSIVYTVGSYCINYEGIQNTHEASAPNY